MISCVIVAGTFGEYERMLTEQAVRTCRESSEAAEIIVIETHDAAQKYDAKTIYVPPPFNYNRCLNIGAKAASHEHIGFFNNDVFFHPTWDRVLLDAMRLNRLDSASPISRFHRGKPYPYRPFTGVKRGYNIGLELCGWAIVTTRRTLDKIGGFNTSVDFWYSDNLYADQLRKHGLRHALVTDSVVDHLEGGSLTLFRKPGKLAGLTHGQRRRYEAARKNI